MISLVLINILAFTLSWAALPRAKTMLDRLAKTQGNGLFSIDLDVHIPVENDIAHVKETWWVQNGDTLKVTAQRINNGVHETFFSGVYREKTAHRVGLDLPPSGAVGSEFFEGIFHQRSGSQLTKLLIAKKALSQNTLLEKRVTTLKNLRHDAEPFVQYTKIANQFFIGLGPLIRESLDIRLWLEPAKFFIRKISLDGKSELVCEAYEQHPRNLWYPKERWVNFGSKSVVLRTQNVRARTEAVEFTPATLSTAKFSDLRLPEEIREFYSRFR